MAARLRVCSLGVRHVRSLVAGEVSWWLRAGLHSIRLHPGPASVGVAMLWLTWDLLPVALLWAVRRGAGAVPFVAGFFAAYFVVQWIEVSYVMAASRDAAGGDE